MSKIIYGIFNIVKKNLAVLLLFIVWLSVTIPNLNIYWMLVDDGWNIIFSRTLFEKLSNYNFVGLASQLLESSGRFRPAYWLYHMIVWVIGGNSYQFQHFAHMLVIGLTVIFIYLIIKKLTSSRTVSFFTALFYLITPLNAENIFRLGPQEPLLAMFLSILFYLMIINKKVFLSCLVLVLAVFTKETSIALLPVLFLYYIFGSRNRLFKNKKQGFYLWIAICVFSAGLVLISLLRRSGYSTNYYFDITMLANNLIVYFKELKNNTFFIFPIMLIIYLVRISVTFFKKQKVFNSKLDLFEFLFLMSFLCFLLIQLPWKYALSRYLMPAGLFLILFSFIEIFQDAILLSGIKLIKKRKQILLFFLIGIGIYTYTIWGWQLISREASIPSYRENFSEMAAFPGNTTILMNMPESENTIELVYEVQIHLSEFWNRNDIKVEYLNLQNLPKNNYIIASSDQLPKRYPQKEISNLFNRPPFTMINTTRGIVITTPLEVVKQSIKKLFNLLVYKKQFTSDGLYTYYYNYNNWYFYYK